MVNSDWAGDRAYCCLLTEFTFIMVSTAVHYKTRFQKTVATRSTEAKFVAASNASKMVLYLQYLLRDLHGMQQESVVIYKDNMGVYKMDFRQLAALPSLCLLWLWVVACGLLLSTCIFSCLIFTCLRSSP